jgi:hypothetical protein
MKRFQTRLNAFLSCSIVLTALALPPTTVPALPRPAGPFAVGRVGFD